LRRSVLQPSSLHNIGGGQAPLQPPSSSSPCSPWGQTHPPEFPCPRLVSTSTGSSVRGTYPQQRRPAPTLSENHRPIPILQPTPRKTIDIPLLRAYSDSSIRSPSPVSPDFGTTCNDENVDIGIPACNTGRVALSTAGDEQITRAHDRFLAARRALSPEFTLPWPNPCQTPACDH
jgi:hypothetical protein